MVAVIDPALCIGCYVCERACPGDLIRLHKEIKLAVLEYPDECWSCGFCVMDCPTNAIVVSFPKRDADEWRKIAKEPPWSFLTSSKHVVTSNEVFREPFKEL